MLRKKKKTFQPHPYYSLDTVCVIISLYHEGRGYEANGGLGLGT